MKKQALGIIILGFFCLLPFINVFNVSDSTEHVIDNGDCTISSLFYEEWDQTDYFTFQNQVCKISPRYSFETTYIWMFADEFIRPNGTFVNSESAEGWSILCFNSAIDKREEIRNGLNWYYPTYNQIDSIEILISILDESGKLLSYSTVADSFFMYVYACSDSKRDIGQSQYPCKAKFLDLSVDLINNRLDSLQINESFDTIYNLNRSRSNLEWNDLGRNKNVFVDISGDIGKWGFNVYKIKPKAKDFIGMIKMVHNLDQILHDQHITYKVNYCVKYSHHEVFYNRYYGYKEKQTIWLDHYQSTCQIVAS